MGAAAGVRDRLGESMSIYATFAVVTARPCPDPLGVFKGMEPPMARLTLARKIAAIALKIWKKGERFDPAKLKQQAA